MNEWLNHPALKNMDPVKLELIKLAAKQTEGKSCLLYTSPSPRD